MPITLQFKDKNMNVSREQVQSYARSSVAIYMQQVYLWMT
jgi:hypothetical protein